MGACGDRVVSDPRVWGPEAWQTLHVMAQNYPTDPSAQAIEGCANFINALPAMLPSALAGYTMGEVRDGWAGVDGECLPNSPHHLFPSQSIPTQFIVANNDYAGTYNPACAASEAYGMPCTTPAQACVNQTALVSFFLRAHHAVDRLVLPCKRLWTVEEATQAYASQTDFCATGIVWGTLPICKEVGETGR